MPVDLQEILNKDKKEESQISMKSEKSEEIKDENPDLKVNPVTKSYSAAVDANTSKKTCINTTVPTDIPTGVTATKQPQPSQLPIKTPKTSDSASESASVTTATTSASKSFKFNAAAVEFTPSGFSNSKSPNNDKVKRFNTRQKCSCQSRYMVIIDEIKTAIIKASRISEVIRKQHRLNLCLVVSFYIFVM